MELHNLGRESRKSLEREVHLRLGDGRACGRFFFANPKCSEAGEQLRDGFEVTNGS